MWPHHPWAQAQSPGSSPDDAARPRFAKQIDLPELTRRELHGAVPPALPNMNPIACCVWGSVTCAAALAAHSTRRTRRAAAIGLAASPDMASVSAGDLIPNNGATPEAASH